MSAEDSLLFIDANIYLDLYEKPRQKRFLEKLIDVSGKVFSTRQVEDEVRRKKRKLALASLEALRDIAIKQIEDALPFHLFTAEKATAITSMVKNVVDLNHELQDSRRILTKQIDRHEDSVSRALDPIFRNAVPHIPEDLERARERRDRGNPPGSAAKSIGDELNWEQILRHFRGKSRLWIISRDGDFGIYGESGEFLHDILLDDLRAIHAEAEGFLFKDLEKGIEHFLKKLATLDRIMLVLINRGFFLESIKSERVFNGSRDH